MLSRAAAPASLLAATLLAACGSGAGSGDANLAKDLGSDAPRLALETRAIRFHAPANGATPAAAVISGAMSRQASPLFLSIEHGETAIAGVDLPRIDGLQASGQVIPRHPLSLGEGVHRDSIVLRACADSDCTRQYPGSPVTIPVEYVVGIPVTPGRVRVETVEGRSPPPQALRLDYHGGSASWSSRVDYQGASGGWLSVSPANGGSLPATLQLGFAAQRPQTDGSLRYHSATLSFQVGAQGEHREVGIEYTVLPLLSAEAAAAFGVSESAPAAGQARRVDVRSRDPERDVPWSASLEEPAPWLQLSQSEGRTGDASQLEYRLNADAIADLPNGNYYTTIVIESAADGVSPVRIPVELTLDRPFLRSAAPYLLPAGRAARVVLSGAYFDQLDIQGLQVGTQQVTTLERRSPMQLLVDLPALPPGRYPLRLTVPGMSVGSSALLVVQAPFSYVAAGAARPPQALPESPLAYGVLDAERHACNYAAPGEPGIPLAQLRHDGSQWRHRLAPPGLETPLMLVLPNGGRELLALSPDVLRHLDPVTLAATRRTVPALPGTDVTQALAADDGTALYVVGDKASGGRVLQYEPATGALTEPGGYALPGSLALLAGDAAAPLQSASDLFGERWARLDEQHIVISDATGVELDRVAARPDAELALTRDGRRLLVASGRSGSAPLLEVYDIAHAGETGFVIGPPQVLPLPPGEARGRVLNLEETESVYCGPRGVAAVTLPR
ncbi:hypothetical protein [Solimonas sp. SE-A11]|uniref:hypothetical protein n=1 Tax=Solimonas sp. SE-A11 TaxID=3054954 RepID=UPI00259CAB71|nr:hypothetical protein [Solimonas sp. SE-A11]MDM4770584.1 hypothetical protein [Solimonas sp. SE-A11]